MPRGHYQHKRKPPISRFWSKVAKTDDPNACWLWTACKTEANGYGQFWDGERLTVAHRFLYQFLNGPIADDLDVCHSCDVPACCNPSHLFVGSRADNMMDCSQKGRTVGQSKPECLTRGLSHYTHTSPHLRLRGSRHGQAKLTEEDAKSIRDGKGVISQRALAKQFRVSQATISNIHCGRNWTHT